MSLGSATIALADGERISQIPLLEEIQAMDVGGLRRTADAIKTFLLENISATGGHIGANLGTIELTLALHHVYRSPTDRIIFDTGHQGYTHKLLTGRTEKFRTLNSRGGLSRFLCRAESVHDPIDASHAGTAISIGLGIAMAMRIRNDDGNVVSIVGDGSLCEGMSFEALNHAVVTDARIQIVLNDNGYAISPGFGAMHNLLRDPKHARNFFSSMGYRYLGPVDGHDLNELLPVFRDAREGPGVPVVHVKTIKGNGWDPANHHPYRCHFLFPFDRSTGTTYQKPLPSYADVAAGVVESRMESDDRIVCVTPSTIYATGLTRIVQRFPDRMFDPGMVEQHAAGLATGLSLGGLKPVLAYQSTFMQRAFDQLMHDVCFHNSDSLILSVRSGFSGFDSPTHHGIYDFAFLQSLPNLRILYPRDAAELRAMVEAALTRLSGPTIILMPYGPATEVGPNDHQLCHQDAVCEPELCCSGSDVCIISVGNVFKHAELAMATLKKSGVSVGLINIRQLKPFPTVSILQKLGGCCRLVTVEEAPLIGGIGATIVSSLMDHGARIEALRIGLPLKFIEPGDTDELERAYELDGESIVRRVLEKWPEIVAAA